MSLENGINKPVEKKETNTEQIKQVAKQDILDLSRDEHIQRMKDRYGESKNSFIKGVRSSDEYGSKVKNMTDDEVIEFTNKEGALREYWNKHIEKSKSNNPSPYLTKEQNGSFDQKIYSDIQKKQGTPAAFHYAARAKHNPDGNIKDWQKQWDEKQTSASEKKETQKNEAKKEEAKPIEKPAEPKKEPEKKSDDKKETIKEEIKKEENKPTEKPAEQKKEPEKAPDKKPEKKEENKSFRKKLNPKNWFPKKEKKSDEKKGGKGFWKTTGDVVTYLPKQAWKATKRTAHQTANLIKYPIRTARSTVKFGRQYMDHGFSKKRREKNKGEYFSKWKWEQAAKKKEK